MSKEINEIRRLFDNRIHEAGSQFRYATVKKVDAELRTCDVQIGGIVYEGVLLHAVQDAGLKGFAALPKVGSTVIVTTGAGGKRLFVALFSEIDKVIFTAGDKVSFTCDATTAEYVSDKIRMKASGNRIEIEADKIVLNGGELGGLVNVGQITDKLNELLDALKNHTHSIPIGGVVVSGLPNSGSNPALVNVPAPQGISMTVARGDYEDKNVTH